MRSLVVLLLLAATLSAPARADLSAAHEACARAATAYAEEDYATAAGLYQEALDAGLDAAVVHYDLGNARFKQGELGSAIASYLRALRIDPRHAATRTNLERARAQIKDLELSGGDLPPVLRPFRWVYSRLSANEWLALALALWVLTCGLRVLGHWRPLPPAWLRGSTRLLLAAALLTFLVGGLRYQRDFLAGRAVVVAEEVEVRSGPGSGYNLAFRVHEGLPVRVAEDRGDWLRIDLGGELVGWVRPSALESI